MIQRGKTKSDREKILERPERDGLPSELRDEQLKTPTYGNEAENSWGEICRVSRDENPFWIEFEFFHFPTMIACSMKQSQIGMKMGKETKKIKGESGQSKGIIGAKGEGEK